jgi:hypothetical protein
MRIRSVIAIACGATTAMVAAVPLARGTTATAGCTDPSRDCVIAAATTYIDAFLSKDGSSIRLAQNARRTENGMETGTSGPEIANDMTNNQGDHAIYAIRDLRWFVDGEHAVAYYLQDTSLPNMNVGHTSTVHLAERFRVQAGLITEIEAVFWVTPGPTPEASGWEPPAG